MFPENNLDAFIKANKKSILSQKYYNEYNLNYITYIQSRINANLILLNNPNLIQELGLNYDKILKETKELFRITSYVETPDFTQEKNRK